MKAAFHAHTFISREGCAGSAVCPAAGAWESGGVTAGWRTPSPIPAARRLNRLASPILRKLPSHEVAVCGKEPWDEIHMLRGSPIKHIPKKHLFLHCWPKCVFQLRLSSWQGQAQEERCGETNGMNDPHGAAESHASPLRSKFLFFRSFPAEDYLQYGFLEEHDALSCVAQAARITGKWLYHGRTLRPSSLGW